MQQKDRIPVEKSRQSQRRFQQGGHILPVQPVRAANRQVGAVVDGSFIPAHRGRKANRNGRSALREPVSREIIANQRNQASRGAAGAANLAAFTLFKTSNLSCVIHGSHAQVCAADVDADDPVFHTISSVQMIGICDLLSNLMCFVIQ